MNLMQFAIASLLAVLIVKLIVLNVPGTASYF